MADLKNTIVLVVILVFSVTAIDFVAGKIVIPRDYNAFRCAHPFYHHGLLPNREDVAKWGNEEYRVYTNSLGLRDCSARKIEISSSKRRILFIGDSFTEGIGIPYENTFAGIIGSKIDADVLNAGVVGYSPRLYYLKAKYLLETAKINVDEAVILIDISDILNELEYEDFSPTLPALQPPRANTVDRFLLKYSAIYYLISRIKAGKPTQLQERLAGITPCWGIKHPEIYNSRIEASWTLDNNVYEKFGKKGLRLADDNMKLLVDLLRKHNIRPHIIVYPWPAQIYAFDKNSIQVQHWRKFCQANGVAFLDLFPAFIDEKRFSGADEVYNNFFIRGDIHWNAAGHDLVAQNILSVLDKDMAVPKAGMK